MATISFINKIWKILGSIGILAGGGAAGTLVFTLSPNLLQNININFGHNGVINNSGHDTHLANKDSSVHDNTFNTSVDNSMHDNTFNTSVDNSMHDNSFNIKIDNSMHDNTGDVFNLSFPVEKINLSSTSLSFTPATYIYKESSSLELNQLIGEKQTFYKNLFGSPPFLSSTEEPLTLNHSKSLTNPEKNHVLKSISAFLTSLISTVESTANQTATSCPAR